MPKKKTTKKTKSKKKPKGKELKLSYIPELSHREFADGFIVRFKKSGLFALSFLIVNPHRTDEGSIHTTVYLEADVVANLAKDLNDSLAEYQKKYKGK